MPNRFLYRVMTHTEFRTALAEAGIADGDLQRLYGRHRIDIVKLLNGDMPPRPMEAAILDYLARYPDRLDDLMKIVDEWITGHKKDENRATRRAHLQPPPRKGMSDE